MARLMQSPFTAYLRQDEGKGSPHGRCVSRFAESGAALGSGQIGRTPMQRPVGDPRKTRTGYLNLQPAASYIMRLAAAAPYGKQHSEPYHGDASKRKRTGRVLRRLSGGRDRR